MITIVITLIVMLTKNGLNTYLRRLSLEIRNYFLRRKRVELGLKFIQYDFVIRNKQLDSLFRREVAIIR